MKRKLTILAFAVVGLLLAAMPAYPAVKKNQQVKNTNTFSNPDFAFPQAVEDNAGKVMTVAMKSLSSEPAPYVTALRCAMQIVIARNAVSKDNAASTISLMDSIASVFETKPGFGKTAAALARLIEANIYSQIYLSSPWVFNRRTLPQAPATSDPQEWSGDDFSRKITELVSAAMSRRKVKGGGEDLPLSTISDIVTNWKEAEKIGFTIYDFMVSKSMELLSDFAGRNEENIIPFFSGETKGNAVPKRNASELMNDLADEAVAMQESKGVGQMLQWAVMNKADILSQKEKMKFIVNWKNRLYDTPYCGEILRVLYDFSTMVDEDSDLEISLEKELSPVLTETKEKGIYSMIEKYLSRYPDAWGNGQLKNVLSRLSQKMVSFSLPDFSVPGKVIEAKVDCRNVNNLFLLVFKVPDDTWNSVVSLSKLKTMTPVRSIEIKNDGTVPFLESSKFTIEGLEQGVYAIVPSSTKGVKGIYPTIGNNRNISKFMVSGITVCTSEDYRNPSGNRIYVVDSRTQKPVAGAAVTWTERYPKKKVVKTSITNHEGYVKALNGNYDISVRKGKDFFFNSTSEHIINNPERILKVNLLTDLSIYKPGDSIGFVAVAYDSKVSDLRIASGRQLKVLFTNANSQTVDSLDAVTDAFGRISGRMKVPENGLLGTYRFRVIDGTRTCGRHNVNVAEYKTPTFQVIIDGIKDNYKIGDTVRIEGQAITYSGMPVANAKVDYDVRAFPLWWFQSPGNGSYGATVSTDKKGKFVIELPTEGLRGSEYTRSVFQLNVSATSPAGETQQAQPVRFSLGEAYSISGEMPDKICIDESDGKFKIDVIDILGHPVKKEVIYKVINVATGDTVMTGGFESPLFRIDLSELGPGEFEFKFIRKESEKSVWSHKTVLWKKGEKEPPYQTPLWVEENRIVVKSGVKKVKVPVGTSYSDEWILAVVSNEKGVLGHHWLKNGDRMRHLEVDAPSDNERIWVTFSGMYNFASKKETVTLVPEFQLKKLEVKTETFRDRLTPGAKEKWSFVFSEGNVPSGNIPAMAVMSNKALDAIAPFSWIFNPYGLMNWNNISSLETTNSWRMSENFRLSNISQVSGKEFTEPRWMTYGMGFYNPGISNRLFKMRSSKAVEEERVVDELADGVGFESVEVLGYTTMNKAAKMEAAAAAAGYLSEETVEAVMDEDSVEDPGTEQEPLREIECPLAFFMPELTSDSEGRVTLDFTVPDFNTTWKLQIAGYDLNLKGTVMTLEAVASKPVMVAMNAPRFVRTGDNVSIAAALYNNTKETAAVGGRFVIFDPMTGSVIKEVRFDGENVAASCSRTVSIEFTPASEMNMVGIRAYASLDNFSDGEQTVIPVLPSSSPVIDSETFYMESGEGEKRVKVPSKAKDATVTLQYCDNPIWECITALPDISNPDSENVLSLIYALYGNAVSSGLASRYPQIVEALKIFADPANSADSTLVSNLQKNSQLKTLALDNTPWVRNAASETLRMSRLVELTDPALSKSAIASLMAKIGSKQKPDGGWSWCDGMQSSEFITGAVLVTFSELKRMGFMPDEAKDMIVKAVRFCDSEFVKEARKNPHFDPANMANYLYMRGQFNVNPTADFQNLRKRCIEAVKKDWKTMGVYYKAISAALLFRDGYKADALSVLESLRQYALQSPEKGMWWDNLTSGYGGATKLEVTSMVLNSWHEISSLAPEVDRIRQWLLLQKQTGEWGDNRFLCDVVSSIITTGTKWLKESKAPEIRLGGKTLEIPRIAKLTGNMTLRIDKASAGSEITIRKYSASPSWGGVISQYVAPVTSVKAEKVPQLSITKDVLLIRETANGSEANKTDSYHVGDKVRVTLTIKATQDIDYVAVTDERAACMEPVEQLSGYTSTDRLWYYQETRDKATNLFIGFLPKGTYVVTYDCHIDREGDYALGIATAQSQYAPLITAHSAGKKIEVK